MFSILSNTGIIQDRLDDKTMNRLKFYIKNKKKNISKTLAGNIHNSFNLQDKFIHCYGDHSSILKKHKLDVLSIRKKLNIK